MRILVVLSLMAVAAVSAAPKSLPSTWKKCKASDPELGACLRDAIHVAIADLSERGAKEYGIFPLDPLLLSRMYIGQGHGPVALDLLFTDINLHGLKNAVINEVTADVDKLMYTSQALFPQGLKIIGHYKVDGKVLVLPIKGDGECELNLGSAVSDVLFVLENVTATWQILGKKITKDGQIYGEVTDFKFTFDPTRLKMRFDNLFNGNKELSTQMNTFLNENWMDILQELKPAIQEAFGTAFREIINRLFSKVPYNALIS